MQTYNGLIIATGLRHGLERSRCDDVAQTTWMRLFQGLDRLRDDAALPGWLITTSTREVFAILRREGRELPTDGERLDVPAHPEEDGQPWENPDDVMRGRLNDAIRALPERDRRLILDLLDPARFSYLQIGLRLGMPVGSIGPIRQRALRKLRAHLSDLDPTAPDRS